MAEKQAQQQELAELRAQVDNMSRNMAILLEQLTGKEDTNHANVRNTREG